MLRPTVSVAVAAALAAGAAWYFRPAAAPAGHGHLPAAAPPATMTVTPASVENRSLRGMVSASGTVSAWREVVVGAEVGGLAVTSLGADEGDHVRAGDILATLSDAVLRAQVDQQRASLVQAEAALESARVQDRNAAALAPIKAISREEAEQRRANLKAGEGKREAAAGALAEAEARLGQARVASPVAGTVLRRSVAAGAVAATGAEFFRILQDDRLEVEASVPEADVGRVHAGQSATVFPPSGPPVRASVRLAPVSVDPKTRLGTARLALPTGSGLRPGMFARAEIVAEDDAVPSIPVRALVWREGRSHAFRIDQAGIARLVPVSTGRQAGEYVEVRSGLAPGDRVAVAGAGFLADGDAVRTAVAEAGR